jgi:hypothetical protein
VVLPDEFFSRCSTTGSPGGSNRRIRYFLKVLFFDLVSRRESRGSIARLLSVLLNVVFQGKENRPDAIFR